MINILGWTVVWIIVWYFCGLLGMFIGIIGNKIGPHGDEAYVCIDDATMIFLFGPFSMLIVFPIIYDLVIKTSFDDIAKQMYRGIDYSTTLLNNKNKE